MKNKRSLLWDDYCVGGVSRQSESRDGRKTKLRKRKARPDGGLFLQHSGYTERNCRTHEPPNGTETCSWTTIHPCARFSNIMVQRPLRWAGLPCLLTRSAAKVKVAQASDP